MLQIDLFLYLYTHSSLLELLLGPHVCTSLALPLPLDSGLSPSIN